MVRLLTPKNECSGALEVKGSRFVAYLIPVDSFGTRLAKLHTEHRKASHIVTATRIVADDGSIEDRARDDGEPGGTAGRPALKVLSGAGVVDAGVAVVRYFGGTKLGTGGLARAYGGAAAAAVEAASLIPWHRIIERSFRAGFAEASALEQALAALPLIVTSRTHTEEGTVLTARGPVGAMDDPSLAGWIR